jgi:hypothetical protein
MKKDEVFANMATKIYHRSDKPHDSCRISEIKPENRKKFKNRKKADEAKLMPCAVCYPDEF